MADARHLLGHRAEAAVAAWLTQAGWQVLDRRWRAPGSGELDVVCVQPPGILVGIEVRARRNARTGEASESIDGRRVARLRVSLAQYAAASRRTYAGLRLDLVTVTPDDATPGAWRLRRLPGVDAW
jgi:Holliday junction resolvase-like predicted endonuclease